MVENLIINADKMSTGETETNFLVRGLQDNYRNYKTNDYSLIYMTPYVILDEVKSEIGEIEKESLRKIKTIFERKLTELENKFESITLEESPND